MTLADVTRLDDMQRAVAEGLQRFGRIDGVDDRRAPAVAIPLNNDALTRRGGRRSSPRARRARSSSTSRSGASGPISSRCAPRGPRAPAGRASPGQCAATAFLGAFAQRRAAGDGPLRSPIEWDPWQRQDASRGKDPEPAAGLERGRRGRDAEDLARQAARRLDARPRAPRPTSWS